MRSETNGVIRLSYNGISQKRGPMRPARKSATLIAWSVAAAILTLSGITGCSGDVELFGDLDEKECNEMLAVLGENDIQAKKSADGDSSFKLMVTESELGPAIVVLQDNGFPHNQFRGISEEFPQSGLISSPYQERIRYMHAQSEELAMTITRIDGVIDARVHIVLPETTAFGEQLSPSSASVFIKHSYDINMSNVVPEIKAFISNSVEGLEEDKVSVVLVESAALRRQVEAATQLRFDRIFSIDVKPTSASFLRNLLATLAGIGVINLILAVTSTVLCLRARRKLAKLISEQSENATGEDIAVAA